MKIFRFFLNKHYQLDKHVLNIHISFQHLGLCVVIYRAVILKLRSLSNRSSNNCTKLEMKVLWLQPGPTESEILGGGQASHVLTRSFSSRVKFESHY